MSGLAASWDELWHELIPRIAPRRSLSVRLTASNRRSHRVIAVRRRYCTGGGRVFEVEPTASSGRCSAPLSRASIVLQRQQTRLLRVVGPAAWRRRADGPSTTSGSARLGLSTHSLSLGSLRRPARTRPAHRCVHGSRPDETDAEAHLEQRQVRVDRIGCPPPRSSARERPFVVMDRRACT